MAPFGLGGVSDDVSEVLGKSRESSSRPAFQRKFGTGDFDSFGGTAVDGEFSTIAAYTVPAGTEISWGYGSAKNEANQGYIYALIQDTTPAEVDGVLRLAQTNPTGRRTEVVADFDTEELKGSKTDRSQKQPLPEQVDKPLVTQDSRILVQFRQTTGANVEISEPDSDVSMPVTEYDLG